MTGKQGRRRDNIKEELGLENLIGKFILVTEFEGNKIVNYNAGILKVGDDKHPKNQGYFLNGIQIPIRSIIDFDYDCRISVDNNYLKKNKKEVTA